MIKELVYKLAQNIHLQQFPFAEFISGIVKAVTYTEENFDQTKTTFTIPVSWYTNAILCPPGNIPERPLVPDSSKRGIIYFEDGGITYLSGSVYGDSFLANVTLVCWYNKEAITGNAYTHMQTMSIQMLMQAMNKGSLNPINLPPFTRVSVRLNRVEPQDGAVFSKYTYQEEQKQYLMPPFEYFALDLSIRFTVPVGCVPEIPIPVTDDPCLIPMP